MVSNAIHSGANINYWTLLHPHNDKKGFWWCQCECGNKKLVYVYTIKKGLSKSCGLCKKTRYLTGEDHVCYNGFGELQGNNIAQVKAVAKRKGRKFEVSMEYLWNLFLKQNRVCALSGIEIGFYSDRNNIREHIGTQTASLDRIDSNGDYVEGNVQWLHKDVNYTKNAYDQDYFINTAVMISEYYNKDREFLDISDIPIVHGNDDSRWTGYGDISGTFFGSVKNDARRYGNKEFTITTRYIWELYLKQGGKCWLSGQGIYFSPVTRTTQTASLDRIDSTKGYIEGNIQIIHKHINRMKLEYKLDYFVYLMKCVAAKSRTSES